MTKTSNSNGAANGAADVGNDAAQPLTPEMAQKLAELRERIQTSVGQTVLAMTQLPRYRHQSIADLQHLVLEPLLRDRVAIATAKGKEDADTGEPVAGGTAGVAIWASVSGDVAAKIREQVQAGAFPVRLQPEDWASGDTLWLLDVIAPNRRLATAVLANFKQIAKDRPVHIHPIVANSVDREVLEQMRVKPSETSEAKSA